MSSDSRTVWVLGAAENCDIRVEDGSVSGQHCRISTARGGKYLIEDLGSTNGTYVNGSRIDAATLVSESDSVTLGKSVPMPWPKKASPQNRTICIGAAADNDIVLDLPMISGHHAQLRQYGNSWQIVDLGSTNGTFIGAKSERITEATVASEDTIVFGSHKMKVAELIERKRLEPAKSASAVAPQTMCASNVLAEKRDHATRVTGIDRRVMIAMGVSAVVIPLVFFFGYYAFRSDGEATADSGSVTETVAEVGSNEIEDTDTNVVDPLPTNNPASSETLPAASEETPIPPRDVPSNLSTKASTNSNATIPNHTETLPDNSGSSEASPAVSEEKPVTRPDTPSDLGPEASTNSIASSPSHAEIWSDSTGNFRIQAEYVDVQGRDVVLRKSDGSIINVPIDRLGAASRELARRHHLMARQGTKPASPDVSNPPSTVLATSGAPADPEDIPHLRVEAGGHTAICNWIGFSPDGMQLLSAGDDKVIRVWDVSDPRNPQLERSIRGEIGFGGDGMIHACAISPQPSADGRRRLLASGGFFSPEALDEDDEFDTGQIRLFDLYTGELLGVLNGHEVNTVVNTLDFSLDGRYLVSGGEDAYVYLWDLQSLVGEQPARNWQKRVHNDYLALDAHSDVIIDVRFAGKGIFSNSADLAAGWSLDNRGDWDYQSIDDDEVSAEGFVLSPDGRVRGVTGWNDDGIVVIAQELTASKPSLLKFSDEASGAPRLAFSPDGKDLLVGGFPGDAQCRVFRVSNGAEVSKFDHHDGTVQEVVYAPRRDDGQTLVATTGGDRNDIWLWDPANGQPLGHIVSGGKPILAVAFSPDGKRIAYGDVYPDDLEADLWPLSHTFDLSRMVPGGPVEEGVNWVRARRSHKGLTAEFRRGGERIVTFDRGEKLARIDSLQEGEEIYCWSFVPDDSARIIVGSDFGLYEFDAETGDHLGDMVGHEGSVYEVAVSRDGRFIASAGNDQTIRLWNAETLEMLLTFYPNEDGEWVIWNEEGYYKSSPFGDRLFGWHLNQGDDHEAEFYTADQFRSLYDRPELVRLIYERGSVEDALEQFNLSIAARGQQGIRQGFTTRSLENNAPPNIQIIGPKSGNSTTERITLSFRLQLPEAAAKSQKNVFTYVMRNGRPIAGWEKREHSVAEIVGGKDVFNVDVDLVPGMQTLSVVSASENEVSRSQPQRIEISSPVVTPAAKRPHLVVLAIGVSDYKDPTWNDLAFADDDALALRTAFDDQKGLAFADVQSRVLTDQQANRADVYDAFAWVRQTAESIGDNVVICVCVAGHGVEKNGDYLFVPHDFDSKRSTAATSIRWTEFLQELRPIKNGQIILLMDTCHSAGVSGEGSGYSLTKTIKTATDSVHGFHVFTSSLQNQTSLEHTDWGHGAFTLAILEALSGQQRQVVAATQGSAGRGQRLGAAPTPVAVKVNVPMPDSNGNGQLDLIEFEQYLTARVKQLTGGAQQPKAYLMEGTPSRINLSVLP